MLDITHYHSLDERLENGPLFNVLCDQCKKLNFAQLFSGPRYEDFDASYDRDRKLDVFLGTMAEIRPRASECRICHIVAAFHDAVHTDSDPRFDGSECSEILEGVILKPYRTDIVLQTPDLSRTSNKHSIATSLALVFANVSERSHFSSADNPPMSPKEALPGPDKREIVKQTSGDDGKQSPSSTKGVFDEDFPPTKLPKGRPYSIFNCLFTLSNISFIEGRSVLSLSDTTRGSRIDWASLRAWLAACEGDHPMCRPKGRLFAEKGDICIRCVDVESSKIVPIGSETRYLALSYVWGTGHDEMREHIDHCIIGAESTIMTESLPQLVKDAIWVTKSLGERYLWVDCLCIKQSDPNDLAEQIGLMDRIYENCLLTIVTSTSTDIYSRIPGLRSYSRFKSTSEASAGGRLLKAICAASVVGEFRGPWSDRAWTYQEWLLSQRCLFFSNNQILFRCQLSSGLESFDPPRANQFPTIGSIPRFWADSRCEAVALPRLPLDVPSWNFETYADLVRDYTRRSLAKDADILLAFSGLMSKLEYSTGMPFVEGLPENDLLNALTWTVAYNPGSSAVQARRQQRPSWSWDSWNNRVIYPCWQILGSSDLDRDFTRCYEEVHGSKPPKSRRAKKWARRSQQTPRPIIVSLLTDHTHQVPHRAYQLRRATLSSPSTTDTLVTRSLLLGSETRLVLVKVTPRREGPRYSSDFEEFVLHPSTEKIIYGDHLSRMVWLEIFGGDFYLFNVRFGVYDKATTLHHDAILLYEWKIEGSNGKWYHRVLAMIIKRLANGTAERVAIATFCSDDWYSLPLVRKFEDVTLV